MKFFTRFLLITIAVTCQLPAANEFSKPNMELIQILANASCGPLLQFEKISNTGEGLQEFCIKTTDDEASRKWELFAISLDGETSETVQCYVNQEGYFTRLDGDAPLRIAADTRYPGERTRFYAVATNFTRALRGDLVPRPIKRTQNGYTLEIISCEPSRQIFSIEGSGFEPNESIRTTSRSGQEVIPAEDLQVWPDGRIIITSLPGTIGSTGGRFEFTLHGKRGKVTLSSPWGSDYSRTYSGRLSTAQVVFME